MEENWGDKEANKRYYRVEEEKRGKSAKENIRTQHGKRNEEINESEPFTWIKEYSDGTLEQYMDDNIFESTSEVSKTTISSTVFTYGFGFNPTNNLQIDLLGIFNSPNCFIGWILFTSFKDNSLSIHWLSIGIASNFISAM